MKNEYDSFIETKIIQTQRRGFDPVMPISDCLFDWQKMPVRRAIQSGCYALFEDCGLGKTLQQIEWARHVQEHTQLPVLILCPLAVAPQTIAESAKFGLQEIRKVQDESEIEAGKPGTYITNYERLHLFANIKLGGVCLDESSILKSFMGKTRQALTERFKDTPFRLACTATPAPNDYMEFGQHAEFLGVMPSNEMLARWFINDTMNFGTYRLKGHAVQSFWEWVASWAACISKPSDIGFSDDGYDLPELSLEIEQVRVDEADADEGELFSVSEVSATNIHKELKRTVADRAARVADIVNGSDEFFVVWCNTNYEADELVRVLPGAIEVRGTDAPEIKERKLNEFTAQKHRVIITKPGVAGYGLNWQHCPNHVFSGLSYSFEDFYQAMRRGYRFGQTKPFRCIIVQAHTEGNTLETVQRKMRQHEEMREQMKISAEFLANDERKQLTMNEQIKTMTGTDYTIHNGDCVRVAKTIPDNSIDFSVYSPPFANLYIYSADVQDMGNCANESEFFKQYEFLIAEKFRITKPGCLSAVHCKNLVRYANRDGSAGLNDFRGMIIRAHEKAGWTYHSEHVIWKDPVIEMQRTKAQGLLFKQLCQDSRYSRAGMAEYVILFRKWSEGMKDYPVPHGVETDWKFIGEDEPANFKDERHRRILTWQKYASPVWMDISQTRVLNREVARESADEKHICPLQLDVIERCLWLYTNKGDTVFSPFMGIGSEGYCALNAGRKFIGAELKESYFNLAHTHLEKALDERKTLFDK